MRNIKFYNQEYYHIYNRGVDKRKIFMDENDYQRFLSNIKDFNNGSTDSQRDYIKRKGSKLSFGYPKLSFRSSKLVEFICYCLNPNHYHFMLKQLKDGGIEKFMHKLGTGYTKYFNQKYNRSGALFQGPYKAIEVKDNPGLLWLSAYINGNSEIHSIASAEDYPWSSYAYYLDKRKKDICMKKDVLDQFKDIEEYRDFVQIVIQEVKANKKERKKYILE